MDWSNGVSMYAPGVALATSAATCRLLTPAARRLGWVDRPADRKPHSGEIPLVGGLAVLLAVSASWSLVNPPGKAPGWFEACAAIMLLTGFLDDRFHISSRLRFVVQAGVCGVMATLGGAVLGDLGALFTPQTLSLGAWAVPVTVFATVGLINAFNMVDGMDGLAGSLFVVMGGALASCAVAAGRSEGLLLMLVVAAVLGFLLLNARLPWNPRARVFLGDAGSMFLGFCLAWFTVSLSQGEVRAIAPITAVWICAVPLLDTGSLILRRLQAGRAPFDGDLEHLHHLLLRAGFTVSQTCALILLFAGALMAVGLAAEYAGLPEHWRFWGFVLMALCYHGLVHRAWRRQRFLGRSLRELRNSRSGNSVSPGAA